MSNKVTWEDDVASIDVKLSYNELLGILMTLRQVPDYFEIEPRDNAKHIEILDMAFNELTKSIIARTPGDEQA